MSNTNVESPHGDEEFRRDSTILLEEEEEEVEGEVSQVVQMEVEEKEKEKEIRRLKMNFSTILCWVGVVVGVGFVGLGAWVYRMERDETYTDFLKAECKISSGGLINTECLKVDCVPGFDSAENPHDLPCSQYDFAGEQVYWHATILHRTPPITTTLYGDCFQERYKAEAQQEELNHLNTTSLCYYNSLYNWATTVPPPPETDEKDKRKAQGAIAMGVAMMFCGVCILLRRCYKQKKSRVRRDGTTLGGQ